MLSAEELDHWRAPLQEIDRLLATLVDYRSFPELLTHDDPQVQRFVERTVGNVRAARELAAEVLAELENSDAAGVIAVDFTLDGPEQTDLSEAMEPAPLRVIQPPAHLEQITMANPTGLHELILVADHDADGLAELEEMLTGEDYRVLSVRDGFEAISVYARLWAAIDLVILDFDLPGLSGDLVFDELQAINPNVAAVVSCGFAEPGKLNQMLAQGLGGFLPKPYARARLIRQIQQVLAHRPGVGH